MDGVEKSAQPGSPAPVATGIPSSGQDWSEAASVLNRWERRARESQYAHYEAAKALDSANYGLGIPVTVLSTLVGTTIYATLQKQVDIRVQVMVGSISVLTAILAGVQTFLRFGERAEKHRSTAASYGEVRRSIEVATTLPVQLRPPLGEYLSQIEKKLNDLAGTSPNVPDRIFSRALHKMQETSERHAKLGRSPEVEVQGSRVVASAHVSGPAEQAPSRRDPYI